MEIPGINIPGLNKKSKVVTTESVVNEEMATVRAEIATKAQELREEREARKREIVEEVRSSLNNYERVDLTAEMEELGLTHKVWGMIQQAELNLPFNRLASDTDDSDSRETFGLGDRSLSFLKGLWS